MSGVGAGGREGGGREEGVRGTISNCQLYFSKTRQWAISEGSVHLPAAMRCDFDRAPVVLPYHLSVWYDGNDVILKTL